MEFSEDQKKLLRRSREWQVEHDNSDSIARKLRILTSKEQKLLDELVELRKRTGMY